MKKTGMPEFKPGFWASYYECLKFTTLISMVRTTLQRDIISLQRTGTCVCCFRSCRRRSPRWRCRRNGLLINPCYYYETYTSFYIKTGSIHSYLYCFPVVAQFVAGRCQRVKNVFVLYVISPFRVRTVISGRIIRQNGFSGNRYLWRGHLFFSSTGKGVISGRFFIS